MARQWLECLLCHKQYPVGPMFRGCPECAAAGGRGPLEVRYDYASITDFRPDEKASGLWRWHSLLPACSGAPVSLQEGNTPLREIEAPQSSLSLLLKNETVNPTWSYKDRACSVSVTIARELGFRRIAAISTGNLGNSTAAYASAAGMECTIFCHQEADAAQLSLMRLYGAHVVSGGDRAAKMRCLVDTGDWFPCYLLDPLIGFGSPYGVEGYKTISFEIFEALGGRIPDAVFVPVGGGDGLYGIWKGFVELQKLGLTQRLPRMYSAQPDGAAPYVASFAKRLREVEPIADPHTIALSLGEAVGGQQTLWALYDSGGSALSVSDEEIINTVRKIARRGYALEPASAAALACAEKLAREQPVQDETWIVVGTGALVKWPQTLNALFNDR